MAAAAVDQARREWEEGHRRFDEAARDPAAADALLAELELVIAELRRRVGGTFTIAELAAAYRDAERWARDAVERSEPAPGWPRRLAMVQDAAFHQYSRGAVDYGP